MLMSAKNACAASFLLLIPVISCHQRPSEANLLESLASAYPSGFANDSIQPQYLRLADPLTASILKNLARNSSYQIAPEGSPLFCPSNPAPGRHGYMIRLRVDAVMGDSALVAAEQMCAEAHGLISTGIHISSVRGEADGNSFVHSADGLARWGWGAFFHWPTNLAYSLWRNETSASRHNHSDCLDRACRVVSSIRDYLGNFDCQPRRR